MSRIILSVSFDKEQELISVLTDGIWATDRCKSPTLFFPLKSETLVLQNSLILGNETDDTLLQMLEDLMTRVDENIGDLEEKGIQILSQKILDELRLRFGNLTEQKTRRNRLIRRLREELDQLKK